MLSLANFFVYSPLVKAEEANVQQEVYLSFDPSGLKSVEVGKEIGLSLLVENVRQLAGVGLEIKYDPGVLECLPVKQEQPLEPGEVFKQNYFPVKNEVDAKNGILRFAALVELPFKDGFSGTGTLVKMKFKAVKPGDTVLSVTDNELEPVKEGDKINGKVKEELKVEVIPLAEEGTPTVSPSPATGQESPGGGGSLPAGTGTQPGNVTGTTGTTPGQSPISQPKKDETGKKAETGSKTGVPEQVYFSDLLPTHWAFQEVNILVKKGFVKGYQDGTFKPQQNISRQEFAVLIGRIASFESKAISNYSLSYKDADQIVGWARPSVAAATYLKILQGDAEGKFNPQAPISRAEIAAVLIRLINKEKEATQLQPGEILFSDLKNHWAKEYILLAKKLQLVNGFADGSFKPQGQASRAEVAAMLVRLLKYRQLI
jgi:hypothetical protein